MLRLLICQSVMYLGFCCRICEWACACKNKKCFIILHLERKVLNFKILLFNIAVQWAANKLVNNNNSNNLQSILELNYIYIHPSIHPILSVCLPICLYKIDIFIYLFSIYEPIKFIDTFMVV